MSVIRKFVMATLIPIPSVAHAPMRLQESISNEKFQTGTVFKNSGEIYFPDVEQYDARPTLFINAPRK
ncbi:hypothetical protein [Marinobacter sp.]|uniref:hypothetical protein n=1 Tax=Marinobacter sp. TaxID=50741 RepID=UPI003BAA8C47